jgi:indolepyruvate ferredoxin oxidoreductase
VTVSGAKPKKLAGQAKALALPKVPEPKLPSLDDAPWACIVTGVGGTGVVTIGAILGMAAHLEGRGCGMIDMAGLAQKGGAVFSHIRLAKTPEDIHAIRVSAGMSDLVLGCDLVVSGSKKVLASVKQSGTLFVVNTAEVMPGDFTRKPDYSLPAERLKRGIASAAGAGKSHFLDANRIAVVLFGQSIAANMFLLGFAFQKGGVPLSADALERAIELNGEAVPMNREAFRWGRAVAHQPELVNDVLAVLKTSDAQTLSQSLDEVIKRRSAFLTAYQNVSYAERYLDLVSQVRDAEARVNAASSALSEAVARSLFKLMAYKDEYEVARLYTSPAFLTQLNDTFDGQAMRISFHLAPPLLAQADAHTGIPKKMTFGPWMLKAFGLLAKLKGLRGTAFDPFGYTHERRDERARIERYRATVETLIAKLTPDNLALAAEIAGLPERIKGFGHVKAKNAAETDAIEAGLMARFTSGQAELRVAAE